MRLALIATCLTMIWNAVGLGLSPLGSHAPSEAAFQVGASREDAAILARRKVDVDCADQYVPDYCGSSDEWNLNYRDWGPIFYPRFNFVRLRFEDGVVVEAEVYRIFWIVI